MKEDCGTVLSGVCLFINLIDQNCEAFIEDFLIILKVFCEYLLDNLARGFLISMCFLTDYIVL